MVKFLSAPSWGPPVGCSLGRFRWEREATPKWRRSHGTVPKGTAWTSGGVYSCEEVVCASDERHNANSDFVAQAGHHSSRAHGDDSAGISLSLRDRWLFRSEFKGRSQVQRNGHAPECQCDQGGISGRLLPNQPGSFRDVPPEHWHGKG